MEQHIAVESGMHEDHQEYFHKQRTDLCFFFVCVTTDKLEPIPRHC
jgi:hypothetical protein